MPIISSSYEVGVPQVDGRSYVIEWHIDSSQVAHRIEYGPVPVIDYQAVMEARAIQLGIDLDAAPEGVA